MAQSTTGFGFRSTMTVGNTPATQGQSEYKIKSGSAKGIFKNDPISIEDSGGNQGYIQDAAFAAVADGGAGGQLFDNTGGSDHSPLIGVFNGAFFVATTTKKPTFANSFVAATTFAVDYNTGSNDGLGFVIDNPFQEYVIKADAAVTQAMYGDAGYNCTNQAGDSTTVTEGQSLVKLNIAGGAANTKMVKLVRSANDPEAKDHTVAGANQIVIIAGKSNLYNGVL
tara:strand:- start:45 stop:719 length:675 start_codon:yes stop_codon:yes gene_type:complete